MECPECSWLQLYIAILVTIVFSIVGAFVGIILIKYPFKPKGEKRFEQHELNVHIGVIGYMNSFDSYFLFFYDIFEKHFAQIKNLRKNEWLPDPYQASTINETGGFDLHMKPQPEYDKALKARSRLKDLDQEIFENYAKQMEIERKRILEYMDKNEIYLDPSFKGKIDRYLHWTIFYVVSLKSGWNYSDILYKRGKLAQLIINILEKDKKIRKQPHINEFIKKWKDYEESELIE